MPLNSINALEKIRDAETLMSQPMTATTQQTQQELQERVRDMQARINVLQSSRTFETTRMEEEVAVLRAYVAQLETQLYAPWTNIRPDEPPPDY